jgi:small subunit ribosomal protein S20
MPNHLSPKKRVRADAKRKMINKSRVSRIKTFIKKFESVLSTSKEEAASMFKEVQSEIMRGASKGAIKFKTASRKVSRLSKKLLG